MGDDGEQECVDPMVFNLAHGAAPEEVATEEVDTQTSARLRRSRRNTQEIDYNEARHFENIDE